MQQPDHSRIRIHIRGAVQGVGFRPFVFRLATRLHLSGWVSNTAQGVTIEAEGTRSALTELLCRLDQDKPHHALIQSLQQTTVPPLGEEEHGFSIRHSDASGTTTAFILPDMATCPDCVRELFDPADRRYHYPFINCTHCGPRYSIIEALPYDRPNTTMRGFEMCAQCRAEYDDPLDRRFHAQPTACPQCGPQLQLWDSNGNQRMQGYPSVQLAALALRANAVVAVKGLGGFHLMVDARSDQAVAKLRQRKHRPDKPLALMFPSLDSVRQCCEVSPVEQNLLLSPEAPIVLLRRKKVAVDISEGVAPGNPYLGVMLPYTPLHHLLLEALGFPVVATSGNRADEPICTDERKALEHLRGIADLFVVHNRPIVQPVDDSIVQVVMERPMVLRRARGYAPLPVHLARSVPPILATGAHLKNTVAISIGHEVFLSQHIGDLSALPTYETARQVTSALLKMYNVQPTAAACDLHPDYLSTQAAEASKLPVIRVQHHYAHALACMAEQRLDPPALGVVWDGTGYGTDSTIWGGEFLRVTAAGYRREAHLRTFPLIGGDKAVMEPRRSAFGLLYEMYGDDVVLLDDVPTLQTYAFSERVILRTMLKEKLNTVQTSSAGRLFDAVASLLGLVQHASFEGQAAMALEFSANGETTDAHYPYHIDEAGSIDWALMISALLNDLRHGIPDGEIAAKFHNTLAVLIAAAAQRVGEETVMLTGGCFQNRRLLESTIRALRREGFHPVWHEHIPTNDGGIALGQVMAAAQEMIRE